MGDTLFVKEDNKFLSPANGIVIPEDIQDKHFVKITQDGGLEPPHDYAEIATDRNTFYNLLDKNGIHSLDFEELNLLSLFKRFWETEGSELILSPFSLYQTPNFRTLVWKDYPKEWQKLLELLAKIFPGKKIHNYWDRQDLTYSHPGGIPEYFSHKIAGFDILGETQKDKGRIFYLGAETIWHLIRGIYYDLPFTRRHLTVYCVDKNGKLDGKERHFLLSNGQSFHFLETIFTKEYEYYSLDHYFSPSKIIHKKEKRYFDIFKNTIAIFYASKPRMTQELPCSECWECSLHCPTDSNPVGLILESQDFDLKTCVMCGLCNLYCPSGIDLRQKILQKAGINEDVS